MNLGTLIVLAIVLVIVGLALRAVVEEKSLCGCGGDAGGCGGCSCSGCECSGFDACPHCAAIELPSDKALSLGQ